MRLATKLGRPAEMPIPGMRGRGESVPGAWTYVASSRPAILQSPRLSIARSSGLLEPLLNPHVPSGVARWPAPSGIRLSMIRYPRGKDGHLLRINFVHIAV